MLSAVYKTSIMHRRLGSFDYKFVYPGYSVFLDVDRLPETLSTLRCMGFESLNLFGFYRKDHGYRDGQDLRPWVEKCLADEAIAPPEKIFILAMPRVLGFVFNPMTTYYCFEKGDLVAAVLEVKNTFGEQHAYVVRPDGKSPFKLKGSERKALHVSPFLDMDMRYQFRLNLSDERFVTIIRNLSGGNVAFSATQSGQRKSLSDQTLMRFFFSLPLNTLKVVAQIHWHALKLWFRGAKVFTHSNSKTQSIQETAHDS